MNDRPATIRNIVLTGFMGTGKTTVGQIVADFIGWHFVDTDDEIIHRFGMSIPVIFEVHGEEGFRRFETIVAQSVAARNQQVIATGGGMMLSEANRKLFMSAGWVICLTADHVTIRERLSGASDRPLAWNWEKLLKERQNVYNQLPYQIDTTDRTPAEVAQEIIDVWRKSLR